MATLFILSLTVAFYIVVGYPLVVASLGRLRPKPIAKQRITKPVSILVAVHNGETFIADKLESILAQRYPAGLMEILVISDGSTDRTEEIVEGYADRKVQLLRIPRTGKCEALNTAIAHAAHEILVLTDVRQILAPDSLQALVDCFADTTVGAVSGELIIRDGKNHEEASTGLYWRYEKWIRRHLSAIDSIFGATGSFYAIRRELAVPIPSDILLDDVYLPLSGFFRGYRLIHEPAARAYDYPSSRGTEFRRKVRTLGGNYQILAEYPALLGPKNRMWFHYVSYKFARLVLPWIFAMMLISSCFLPGPWRWFFLGLQASFYGMAVCDPVIADTFPLKRLTSSARTIVAMLLATAWGLSVLIVPPRSLWKVTTIKGDRATGPTPNGLTMQRRLQ